MSNPLREARRILREAREIIREAIGGISLKPETQEQRDVPQHVVIKGEVPTSTPPTVPRPLAEAIAEQLRRGQLFPIRQGIYRLLEATAKAVEKRAEREERKEEERTYRRVPMLRGE